VTSAGANENESGNGPDAHDLRSILDRVDEQIQDASEITIEDVLEAFGSRTFGPLYTALGVVIISPIGAIPGAPIVLAILVSLIAFQRIFGADALWLPKRIRNRSVDAQTWHKAHARARPWARRVDRFLKPRITILTTDGMDRVLSVLPLLLGASLIPIGIVPFANMAPGGAILLVGLGLASRDGVLVLASLALTGASAWLIVSAVQ